MEYRVKTKNGTFVDIETTAEVLYHNGKPYAVQGMARDITGRKKAEQSIKESQEKYKRLFDSSPDLIIETDEEGNVLAVNPMMAKSMGAPSEKLIGKNIFDIFPKEIVEQRATIARKAFKEMKLQESEDERAGRYFHNIYVPIVHTDGKKTIQTIVRDITGQKKAERALCDSEEKLRSIVENSSDQIFMLDKDCKFLSVNTTAADISRKSPQEMIGKSISEIFPETTAVQFSKNIKKVFDTGKSLFIEEKMVVQGRELYNSTSLNPVKGDGGRVMAVTGIVRDITERKKAEEELQKSETMLNDVSEMAHVGGWELDAETKEVHWTKETYRIHDISMDEKFDLSKAILFFDLPDRSKLETVLQCCMETGKPFDLILPFTSAKGRHLWTRAIGRAVKNNGGKIVKLTGTFQDITERRKAEKTVIESEEKLRRILDSSPDAITVTDLNGKIIECNQATSMIHGFKKEELIGKNALELFSPKDLERAKENLKKTLESESAKNLEYTLLTKGGREFPAELSACLIRDASGNALSLVATTKDITERKRAEEELEKSKMRLDIATETSQIGVWELDLIYDISIRNLIHDQIFGYKEKISEWGAKIFFEHIIPEDRPSVQVAFDGAMETNKLYFECRILWPDKSIHWITATGKTVRDIAGKPQKMLGTVVDITERKKAEKELNEKIDELEKYKKLTVDRELKMIELKKEINGFCKQLNQKPRYEEKKEN
jgi:PAS domain S-box-containing protein